MANYEFAAFHQIAKPAQELAMLTPLTFIPFTATVPTCRTQLGVNPSALPCLFRPPFDVGEGGGRAGFLCHGGVVCELGYSSTLTTA
jgi:hypothetical protein